MKWAIVFVLAAGCCPKRPQACVSVPPPMHDYERLKEWAERAWMQCKAPVNWEIGSDYKEP